MSDRAVGWIWGLRLVLPAPVRRATRRSADVLLSAMGSVTGFRTADMVAALTFDDGPDPDCTPVMLDLLERKDVPATFFVLAERARSHPDLLRRMTAEGHEVALHGEHHQRLPAMSSVELRTQLGRAKRDVEQITGTAVRLFRPPFGVQTPRTYRGVRRLGMDVVGWGPYAEEWIDGSGADLAHRTLRRLANVPDMQVILLHDGLGDLGSGPGERVEGVALLIDALRSNGYSFGTVSALLERYSARRTAWFRA